MGPFYTRTPEEEPPMKCVVDGCTAAVEKEGHSLCYPHWKAQKAGQVRQCGKCRLWLEMAGDVCGDCAAGDGGDDAGPAALLSSTKLGERLKLPARRVNLLLAELGWIEKHIKGWRVTDQGRKVGGIQKEARQTGIPYAVWPAAVVGHKVLREAVREARGEPETPPAAAPVAAPANTAAAASPASAPAAPAPPPSRMTSGRSSPPPTGRPTATWSDPGRRC